MTIAIEADVRRALSPDREAKIWEAFHQSWEDVASDQGKYGIWARSRANMIFERLAVRLQEQLFDDSGVEFFFADETVKIKLDGSILIRCKKANRNVLGQNIITQAVMDFCHADADLFGFTGFQKVEILYVVNPTGTGISDLIVQARDGFKRKWSYTIGSPEAGAEIIPLPLPVAPASPADIADLVRPRTKPATKEDADKRDQ